MKRISRRSLLIAAIAALPAAAVAALTRPWQEEGLREMPALGGALTGSSTPHPSPAANSRVRTSRSGAVIAVDGDQIAIEGSDGEQVTLLVSDFLVDDGFWVNSLPIEVGDHVTAGSGRLWVNPKFYYGPILEVMDRGSEPPMRFRIQDRYDLSPYHEQQPDGHIVLIGPSTLVVGPLPDPLHSVTPYRVTQVPAANRAVVLAIGQHVEVVGREYHGELDAIRLML